MRLAALSLLPLLLAACAGSPPLDGADGPDDTMRGGAGPATLTGEVTYLPRIALPPDAVVRVQLRDVSRSDVLAKTIAEQTVSTEGRQVPIPFALSYDPDRIQLNRRYAVRAEIRESNGTLRWVSDTVHPALTQGAPTDGLRIRVVQVTAPDANALIGSTWRLVQIETSGGGGTTPDASQTLTIAFGDDGRFSGQADCNAYAGSYELGAGDDLALSQTAATLAACPGPSLGSGFLATLGGVESYRVTGDRLRLRAGGGSALVFERGE